MFYTDTFIEVAVPFPRCRSGIPVRYSDDSCLGMFRQLGLGFSLLLLVNDKDPDLLHSCRLCSRVSVALSLPVVLIFYPQVIVTWLG